MPGDALPSCPPNLNLTCYETTQFTQRRPTEGDVLTGWYAGGGIQYALNDVVRVGAEYRHCDFGDETVNFHSGGPVFPGRTRFDLDSNQVTFRVNIMLGRLGNFGP
jgi:opacity protein-like surface antigen